MKIRYASCAIIDHRSDYQHMILTATHAACNNCILLQC